MKKLYKSYKQIKMTVLLIITALIFTEIANAQFTKLIDFAGVTNGWAPSGSLISDGTFLYGTTSMGGTNDMGTIFKIKRDGTGYVKLLDFAGATNGNHPSSLISDGTFLYGTTSAGGRNDMGTIFKIKPDGTGYAKLFDFTGSVSRPGPSSLISDGTFLYGTTSYGGTNGTGTIFKIKPDGTGYVKLLFDFTTTNGYKPGSLISDGTFLYGTANMGGTNDNGTVFKIKPDGTGFVKLLDFAATTNQSGSSSLISDGTFLYGTTSGNGGTNDKGTVFKIKPDGTGYSKLLDFAATTDGRTPTGSLIYDGTFLYGTTNGGGTNYIGTIFKIKPDGTGYSKLLDFARATNGNLPSSLISDGTFFYGMANGGGTNDKGTLFKYRPPVTFSQLVTVCAGQSIMVGNNTYTTTGIYSDTLTAVNTCDSIVTTNLTVLPANSFSQSLTVSAGKSVTVGSNIYTVSGKYTDVFTSYQGCDSTVITNLTVLPINAQVCIVTVDSVTGKNLIVWERLDGQKIKTYKIYKESFSSTYTLLDSISFGDKNSNMMYIDNVSNPQVKSEKYTITAVDSNGLESPLQISSAYKTIHLGISLGISTGSYNLAWDAFMGFDFATYYIYRITNVGVDLIDSVSNSTLAYTDFAPIGTQSYIVSVRKIGECDASKINKTMSSSVFMSSISNKKVLPVATGIQQLGDVESLKTIVYPNPSTGLINIEYELSNKSDVTIVVSNLIGQTVERVELKSVNEGLNKATIDIREKANNKGVYMIKIVAGDKQVIQKMTIQ